MVKEVKDLIEKIFGKDVLPILEYMLKKKEVSNEELAKKLKINPNTLRKLLYMLEQHNIVSAKRVANGHVMRFEYYWRLNVDSIHTLKQKLLKHQIKILKERVSRMEPYIFLCPVCGLKFSFEEAMQYEFRCPEDGELLVQKENEDRKKLLDLLKKLESELGEGS